MTRSGEALDPREAFPGQPRCDWCGGMLNGFGECVDKCRSWEERTRCAWCRKPPDSADMIQVEAPGFGGECWEFCGWECLGAFARVRAGMDHRPPPGDAATAPGQAGTGNSHQD